MKQVIVVRNIETKAELYRHELTEDEKPWEVLVMLQQMDFEVPTTNLEFMMDPEREERERAWTEQMKEAQAVHAN